MIARKFYSLGFGIVLASGITIATIATAAADDKTYNVDDVVAHFSEEPNLGMARRLCIGTPSECGEPAAPVAATPFNLQVQFEFNSAELTPAARGQLDVFAEAATGALGNARFNIDGHTDATGSERLNLNLSERRANSVVRYLTARGVAAERLKPAGHGESELIRPDDPYNAVNRRVEASLSTGS